MNCWYFFLINGSLHKNMHLFRYCEYLSTMCVSFIRSVTLFYLPLVSMFLISSSGSSSMFFLWVPLLDVSAWGIRVDLDEVPMARSLNPKFLETSSSIRLKSNVSSFVVKGLWGAFRLGGWTTVLNFYLSFRERRIPSFWDSVTALIRVLKSIFEVDITLFGTKFSWGRPFDGY